MSTRYHLDTEGWDTVVEMINWCLMDLEGSSPMDEEEAQEEVDFEARVRKLAQRMGLTKTEVHNVNSN